VLIKELVKNELTFAEKAVLDGFVKNDVEIVSPSARKGVQNQISSIVKKLGLNSRKELQHIYKNW
jgi:hypothetical protein